MKIRAIGPTQWHFRCVIGVLAYGEDAARKNTKFKSLLSYLLLHDPQCKIIKAHGYNFFVIGWEEDQIKNMTHNAYDKWLEKLIGIYNDNGISRETVRRRD